MVPAGNKAKSLSSVDHTTKTIHHLHHQKGSETPVKKLIAISIHFKNLFKLHNLYLEKFHTATNRIKTEN